MKIARHRRFRSLRPARLHHLLNTLKVPASRIIATSRKPDTLSSWAAQGVDVRACDFEDPASLTSAFRVRRGSCDQHRRDRSPGPPACAA